MSEIHTFPCLHCQPRAYIRMVQNLIERCLLFYMDQDQCVKALAEHAKIQPLVTLTVWKELLKENKDFFQSYFQSIVSLSPPYTQLVDSFKELEDLLEEACCNNGDRHKCD